MTDSPNIYDIRGKRVAVAGHQGMVGSALIRRLASEECDIQGLGREAGDLRRQSVVEQWFAAVKPELVFVAAAKVGGIGANSALPADFIYDNLMIATNIINAAKTVGVEKLVFLGSSCIYPKDAPQPMSEDALLSGPLEPTNLYGPGDNFDLETSHVVPALMRKSHEAKLTGASALSVWGSGNPKREFLHVDDLADALVFISKSYSSPDPINVGSGEELTIRELAGEITQVVGFGGEISFDASRPDGPPRKLVDTTRMKNLGWSPSIPLQRGLQLTYEWFKSAHSEPARHAI